MPVTMKQIESHLNDKGIHYFVNADQQVLIAPYPTHGDMLNLTITVAEEGDYIRCSVPCFVNARDAVNREALFAELLHLNYQYKMVKFCYDPSDQEVSVEVAMPIEDSTLTDGQISRLLCAMFHVMRSCRPGLTELIKTGATRAEQQDEIVRKLLDSVKGPGDAE